MFSKLFHQITFFKKMLKVQVPNFLLKSMPKPKKKSLRCGLKQ